MPTLSWRARCWLVVPVAMFYGHVGASSPHNDWDFKSNFVTSYLVWFAISFLFALPKPRPRGPALPRAHVLAHERRS